MASSSTGEASTATAAVAEEKKHDENEIVHKTKAINFLGRTTPIILQNDNGPCPLLAICNVLSLKNCLNLSSDIPEISQERLLSLVAERLLDSNSNVNNKDAGYIENQEQNIHDAIGLLHRLTTGIDVNIKFGRIGDFEFTPECAIFDLLDIPLYHGWIIDPQDHDTANAIGSKSYNTLMGELVALESQNMEIEQNKISEDDCVDFAAATTAALGVPSPCVSRSRSFDDSPATHPDHLKLRKGDIEEQADLLLILKLSKLEMPTLSASDASVDWSNSSLSSKGNSYLKKSEPVIEGNGVDESHNSSPQEVSTSNNCESLVDHNFDPKGSKMTFLEVGCSSSTTGLESPTVQLTCEESKDRAMCKNFEGSDVDARVNYGSLPPESSEQVPLLAVKSHLQISGENDLNQYQSPSTSEPDAHSMQNGFETLDSSSLLTPAPDPDLSSVRGHNKDEAAGSISSVDRSEPMYEGEESILKTETTAHHDREPMYEGEVILAEQGDKGCIEACDTKKGEITPKEGDLIRNFLKNSASQLTVYGLFCLQEGLKERELCVFFRNNHFNTMFKFEDELYILATDQGFLSQPDLVWEKLNEVNGDTVYVTHNFKEFKAEDEGSNTWDGQNAMARTADYLASIENSALAGQNYDADLELAKSLQQEEYGQQPPVHQNSLQQPTIGGGSRMAVGPQVSRNSSKYASHSSKPEPKSSKDKCAVM